MNILLVADCHGKINSDMVKQTIGKDTLDGVFFLGDNRKSDLKCVLDVVDKKIPKIGIVGNHDRKGYLREFGITDIHCRVIDLWGYKIGGFRGSIKYPKAKTHVLYTNAESEKEIEALEACDILLTHDKPRFKHFFSRGVYNEENHVHSGLTGIGEYIRKTKPRYVFFGHLHRRYTIYRGRSRLQCCFGLQMYRGNFKRIKNSQRI